MSDHKQLRVEIILPIDPPRPLISDDALATHVRWGRTITADRDDSTSVSIHSDEGRYCTYYPPLDAPPDWVPRPPASWHAIVSELAAEVLA